MKACFPIVGEKEYKDSISITKQRQWVFTKPRIGSIFISFVSFSFNNPHVSVPTRTCIRASGVRLKYRARSACKYLFVSFALFVFKKSRVQAPSERPAANKDPWYPWDPCAKEYSWHSLYYLPPVSGPTANLVFKTSRESIEIHHWSIPHCGQPQQFNIQHSKLNIALRASVCKKIFVSFDLFVFKITRVQNPLREICVQ